MTELVILVDNEDRQMGTMEKMEAHEKGLMHRAFSIFVFNDKKELLLQRRAMGKYHSPGLWTNTCCSHPRPEESLEDATQRRLVEELGFKCEMREISTFTYRAEFENGLIEHEFDHVFIGTYDGEMSLNGEEVSEVRWVDLKTLREDIKINSENYTAWFKIIMENVSDDILLNSN